jgi:hypothetical protein
VLGLDRFELDSDLFSRDDVDTEVDITYMVTMLEWVVLETEDRIHTERAGTNLLPEAVLATDTEIQTMSRRVSHCRLVL